MKRNRAQEADVAGVVHELNALAKKVGEEVARRGINRWSNAMRAKASLNRRKAELKRELAAVSRKLK